MRTGTGTQSFSLFAMDVKAEGDFDDVRVCHWAPLVSGGIAIRVSALTSTHLQLKFLTTFVERVVREEVDTMSLTKMETELSDSVKLGRGHSRSDLFKKVAVRKLAGDGFTGQLRVLAPGNTTERVAEMYLPPCRIRRFLDAKDLHQRVATDTENDEAGMYFPISPNNPLVDAWCICTIDGKRMVVGLQITTAKFEHPIAGEHVAKAQFNAIHGALAKHMVEVHKGAWVVFVLPSAHFSNFPYHFAKVGPGEQKRLPGRIWAHTQAKLGMHLDAHGQALSNVAAYRQSVAHVTTVELSAAVTAGDLRTLHRMGRARAAQLLAVLHENTRDDCKTVEGFLDYLENSHKTLARVLKHERNRGRWAYHDQVWAAPAPAPVQRGAKRKAGADGTAGGHSPHRGHAKRARRGARPGKLKAERAWQAINSLTAVVRSVVLAWA